MKLLVSDGYFYRSMENESSRVLWFEVQGTVRVSIKVLRRSWVKFCFTFSKVIRDATDNIRMQILEAFKLQVLEILLLYGIFFSFQCYTSSSLGFCISWSFPPIHSWACSPILFYFCCSFHFAIESFQIAGTGYQNTELSN